MVKLFLNRRPDALVRVPTDALVRVPTNALVRVPTDALVRVPTNQGLGNMSLLISLSCNNE
jgi:hypothetical protein